MKWSRQANRRNLTKMVEIKTTHFCRLAQEGALMTIPFLGTRLIHATKKDLEHMLSFCDIDNPPALTLLAPETQEQFNKVIFES